MLCTNYRWGRLSHINILPSEIPSLQCTVAGAALLQDMETENKPHHTWLILCHCKLSRHCAWFLQHEQHRRHPANNWATLTTFWEADIIFAENFWNIHIMGRVILRWKMIYCLPALDIFHFQGLLSCLCHGRFGRKVACFSLVRMSSPCYLSYSMLT